MNYYDMMFAILILVYAEIILWRVALIRKLNKKEKVQDPEQYNKIHQWVREDMHMDKPITLTPIRPLCALCGCLINDCDYCMIDECPHEH